MLVRGGKFSHRVRESMVWENVNSAFEGPLKTGVIVNLEHLDIQDFLANAETQFLREIQKVLKQENAVKVNTTLEGEYSIVKNDEEVLELKTFNTAFKQILQTTDVTQWFIDNVKELRKTSAFQERDSGWTLRSIVSLTVKINKYKYKHLFRKNMLASTFKTLMMINASNGLCFPRYIRPKEIRVDCQITNNIKMN